MVVWILVNIGFPNITIVPWSLRDPSTAAPRSCVEKGSDLLPQLVNEERALSRK